MIRLPQWIASGNAGRCAAIENRMVDHSQLIVTHDGDSAEVIVPMPLPYHPIPSWASTDLSAAVIAPLYLLCSWLIRTIRKLPPPPRARFRIAPDEFCMEFVAPKTGDQTSFACDPAKVIAFRRNQHSKGLWVHVDGQTMHTFMEDFDDDTVLAVAEQVRQLFQSTLGHPIPDG